MEAVSRLNTGEAEPTYPEEDEMGFGHSPPPPPELRAGFQEEY